ncbi:MAG: alpha/beta fold hydrolase [Anaerolineales bacterium]
MTISADLVELSEGTHLALLRAGPVNGEPLILLHGIPTGSELWRGVMLRLAEEGYRCYAPDLPGYGNTRVAAGGDYSIFGAAELIADWLAAKGLQDVWLVGHDWGGAVAQVMGVRYADRLGRLTFTNCPVEDSWPVPAMKLFRTLARAGLYAPLASIGLIPNPYATYQLNKAFYDHSRMRQDTWERVFWDSKVSDRKGRAEFQHHLAALDSSQTIEVAPELGDVELPTLLIWGLNDQFQPWEEVGVRLQALLPDPEVKLIEQAGHYHVLERPETFVEGLLGWRRAEKELK